MTDHLEQSDGGTWQVNTRSGSSYILDLDNMTQKRCFPMHGMRRDWDAVPLLSLEPVDVPHPMVMVIQVVEDRLTVRTTSPVMSIRRLS